MSLTQGLDRLRQAARRDKEARFTALLHHVDIDCLREAYRAINPKAAAGVDGVTGRLTGRTWRRISRTSTGGCTAERTGPSRCGG